MFYIISEIIIKSIYFYLKIYKHLKSFNSSGINSNSVILFLYFLLGHTSFNILLCIPYNIRCQSHATGQMSFISQSWLRILAAILKSYFIFAFHIALYTVAVFITGLDFNIATYVQCMLQPCTRSVVTTFKNVLTIAFKPFWENFFATFKNIFSACYWGSKS